ncbi:hypothetical protein [Kurthia sibirica]|uniref:Uncharacterized protein n=1 Tax=Kurthia sibirica TaxID=202750 RepID=A0A2U3ADY0_9BACL|nr:hypothetical protein [Kurthia sibirica]PWI22740.1 hypothetical protein DEX24_16740 [Kurthia sibirica]GEK35683.1 hypothetical protein KSI01_32160 [Kurthia sibirica]
MESKYNKYISLITIVTIITLILFSLNEITKVIFLIIFIPLSISMLLFGILEFKKTLKKSDEDIKKHVIEIKNKI